MATEIAVSLWMGDRLLDFVDEPANTIFGCNSGWEMTSSSPGPGMQGKASSVAL